MRLLAFTKYGPEAASTRQRFLQYRPALNASGISLSLSPLLGDEHVRNVASGRRSGPMSIIKAYGARIASLRTAARTADVSWVHCEAFPYAPAAAEAWAARRARPYVFDYDDAIFQMYDGSAVLRNKLKPIIAGAAAVIAGNAYLADYARQWNANVHIVPTVVDTGAYVPAETRHSGPPVIGWIGSPSTWTYVRPLLSVIVNLCRDGRARFLAVGPGHAAEADRFDGMELREWSQASEIADVQGMDIGIMPLSDDPWARGKCGYKLIQYMACGVPTVASPVGVNVDLAAGGTTGLLASSPAEWASALSELISRPAMREAMGKAGRALATSTYSLEAQAPRLTRIFACVMAREGRATG